MNTVTAPAAHQSHTAGVEPRLTPGSPVVECLRLLYEGEPAIVAKSPPGAGKSTLIADVCNYLVKRGNTSAHVAAPTHRAVFELAVKLVGMLGHECVVVRAAPGAPVPRGAINEAHITNYPGFESGSDPHVLVTTVASLEVGTKPTRARILIVDEAYQVKYRQLAVAADGFDQLVMVGDPGQIGPVDTGEATSLFRGSRFGPNRRGPEAVEALGAKVIHLPYTYRVGQETVDVIAPLYEFGFSSRRIDRSVDGLEEIEAIQLPANPSTEAIADEVLACVSDFLDRTITEVERDGQATTRAVTRSDIVVIAARNVLVAAIREELDKAGLAGVVVDTADRLQGGQWHAVISVDPVIHPKKISEHALSTGRLCVMVSRHMSHLTWLYAEDWLEAIEQYEGTSASAASPGIVVRRRLTEGHHG